MSGRKDEPDLSRLDGLCELLLREGTWLRNEGGSLPLIAAFCQQFAPGRIKEIKDVSGGRLLCPECRGDRIMKIDALRLGKAQYQPTLPDNMTDAAKENTRRDQFVLDEDLRPQLTESMFRMTCFQCGQKAIAVCYDGPDGPSLMLVRGAYENATTNTPLSVGRFLDQALKCISVGAGYAALAMYRVALDELLIEQGFDGRTCGAKLKQLKKARSDPTAKQWVRDLDDATIAVMFLLKDLGDKALHAEQPAQEDVSKQEEVAEPDEVIGMEQILTEVRLLFIRLLDHVYERPEADKEILKKLRIGKDLAAGRRFGTADV